MKVEVTTIDEVKVVALDGEIDASTAAAVQQQILLLTQPDVRLLLDMTRVPYMSSAGLRVLLSAYRQVAAKNGRIVLVGLDDEIRDTMDTTGFLPFFTVRADVPAGLEALR
ncbi:MAG TPA: anti-sigma factor antagonist [Planctomycetota bacterium]|nr:anti-sigma factor antagonist [Planctomycetota bacterium]